MANLMFLKTADKIKGESTDEKHKAGGQYAESECCSIHALILPPTSMASPTRRRARGK